MTRFRYEPSRRGARLPGECPVTWALIGANAVTFLLTFIGVQAMLPPLAFQTFSVAVAPWTLLTYPLVGAGHVLWLLIGGYMLWMFGGSLERGWGRKDYLLFLVLITVGTAAALWVGGLLTGRAVSLAGPWMPLAAAVVAWAAINPHERLLVYFAIPVQARWLSVATGVLVFFSFPFPLGLFALAGCGLSWWYARGGRFRIVLTAVGRRRGRRLPAREEGLTRLNPIEAIRRWRRRRQFLRLMKKAGVRDREKP